MKKAILLGLFWLVVHGVSAQFDLTVLDDGTEFGAFPFDPSIAINQKDPANIVAVASNGGVYVTTDAGKTWTKKKIESRYGFSGIPVVRADSKGNFYLLHQSDAEKTKGLSVLVCHRSNDNGESWSAGDRITEEPQGKQSNVWATMDPKSNAIIATWTQFNPNSDEGCVTNILLSESGNGSKWADGRRLNRDSGDCSEDDKTVNGSASAIGPDGERFVVWSIDETFYLDRSMDKGKIWLRNDLIIGDQSGGWKLEVPGVKDAHAFPSLISDNSATQVRGALYFMWSDQRSGETNTDIWFSRSFNYGDTWSPPIRVFDEPSGRHQFHASMAQDVTTGFLYVIYYDRSLHENDATDVYLAYSLDGGTTFVNNKISSTPFIPTEDSILGSPAITAHAGRIVPVWTRMDEGRTSIITTVIDQDILIPQLAGKDGDKKKKKKK